MNKHLIKKYKPEFDHWLNEGEILKASYDFEDSKMSAWYKVECNENWNFSNVYDYRFIINDEYIEFRKALAEDKTVEEYYDACGQDGWIPFSGTFSKYGKYRIKPVEPPFQIGEWVYIKDRNITIQATEENLKATPGYFCYSVGIGGINYDLSDVIKWAPKEGEWCWFWNADKYPKLKQVYSICRDMGVHWTYKTYDCKTYRHCEPFIGKLPSMLKEQ